MKFKKYPKTYENVFTSKRTLNKCKIEKVSCDVNWDTPAYCEKVKKAVAMFEVDLFDHLVKIFWLVRRFCYGGINRGARRWNGVYLDSAFGVFMRSHVGIESRMIMWDHVYSKIGTYLDDFFPDFDVRNPFSEKLEYPFKCMSLECLVVVYKMAERLELLKEGEHQKMSYTQFLDYVINYLNCYNDEVGYKHYTFTLSHVYMPYVRVKEKE